ncbi:hypothetical protein L3X38_042457 [Prunus dulcis]|uniref:Uncharacterized protein n=1 Tax=Prunus dulcis TaxID=3755 RepID=A0AAD4YLZ8_PRUDU|nr:hypothetical protein L3X38_042457 [Prunus dulcis]
MLMLKMARPLFESNLVIREGKKRRSNRQASDTGVVPAEGSPMPKSVTGLAFGSFGRCPAPRKCVFLRHGRRRGCLGASRFVAGSARPWKCVFLRHGRRRGCLGASRFVAGTARFIMV